jgi:IclR family pca regulon transcriptional regulator
MDDFSPPSTRAKDLTEQADFVTALARGLAVIRTLGSEARRMTLADVARKAGLARATARRALITLEVLGYVESDGRSFALTPRVLALGQSYLSSSSFPRAVQPLLERLAETIHESCWAAILDGDEVVMVASARTNRILSAGMSIGSRLPAFCTALGRVLLAGLPNDEIDAYLGRLTPRKYTQRTITEPAAIRRAIIETREAGYALADSEVESGLCSIAVPVINPGGRTIAALNATAPSDRVRNAEMIERFLPLLRGIADDLRPGLM